ncbi:MAG TPA: hypothetical protein VE224_20870 [Pseudolabrys sp.]|nr:hypothetical protein [Pseudolabrys sp.]
MTGSRPAMVAAIGLLAMLLGGAAQAQDLSAGKTPAELFNTNCAICHKSPRGLAAAGEKSGGMLGGGLESFLARHYTAEPHSAQILAAYLKSVADGAAPAPDHSSRHRRAIAPHKPAGDKPAAGRAKTAGEKPAGAKSGAHDLARREKPKGSEPKAD